ncbi:MAG TPA: FRG domain-containing protein [Noviherbaspirillum sp.]|nr:FRG domain-containing protein [Noviherbaspirillum sp.]
MPITEVAIRSIGDLAEEVKRLSGTSERWLFRGQANAGWRLSPSVHRGYTPQQERYLTNEFRVRARSRYFSCPMSNDYPGWLALMQHYGLPTRLLDWTYSPLVAAFFALHPDYVPPACNDERNACIWALDARQLNESQGFEPLIFPLDASSYEPLIVPAFKNRKELNTVGVAMAIEQDSRIQLQQGAFTVHSSRVPIDAIDGADQWLCRLVIASTDIPKLFEELTLLGVRKYSLFPDLSALTSELRAMHLPREA